MGFFKNQRQPLHESQFSELGLAVLYDNHARRFMGPVYRRLAAKAARLNLPGSRVLDVGTGTGLLSAVLAQDNTGWHITGVDIADEMLNIAGETAKKNRLAGRVQFVNASADALSFPDSSFDLVISNTSLHLWAQPQKVFNELARVTAPEGFCLIWDNLRLARFNPAPAFMSVLLRMNRRQRRLWFAAMRSAYTLKEVKKLLDESALKSAQAQVISGLQMLEISWQKSAL